MPHSRQIGITGRSVSPRLYVGLGLSGKFNHTVGFRGAGLVVAINSDPAAPIFDACDLGLVGDWREIVPLAQRALDARRMAGMAAVVIPDN
jgi:electron transfer flavoprotein alpha subunit